MAAIHGLQDTIAARLHGKVQIRHQLAHFRVTGNEPLGDVVRVTGRIANPLQFRELGQLPYQPVEPDGAAFPIRVSPGVHVLPKQRDFLHAADDSFRLGGLGFANWAYEVAAQERAVLSAGRAEQITLDGSLDEAAWATAQPATGFLQFEPSEGAPASQPTEVRVLYGPGALYVGAVLRDAEFVANYQVPDS